MTTKIPVQDSAPTPVGSDVAQAQSRVRWGQWVARVLVVLALAMLVHMLITNPRFEWDVVLAWFRAPSIVKALCKLLLRCLVVLTLVIVGFTLHAVVHVEPSIVALVGALVMVLVSRVDLSDVLEEVEWPTLVFFMGLFIMVGGLVHTGVIETIGIWAIDLVGHDFFAAATALVFGSAVLGAFFDNIPYAATMAPIVEGLVASDPVAGKPLWWAFALGADFGGNGTAVAASANVVGIGIAARAGHPITFWQFTRYGIVVTILSTIMAWGYVALRYF